MDCDLSPATGYLNSVHFSLLPVTGCRSGVWNGRINNDIASLKALTWEEEIVLLGSDGGGAHSSGYRTPHSPQDIE